MIKKQVTCTPWINAPETIEGLEGFVYLIVDNSTKRKYIGRKYYWKMRPKRLRKKGVSKTIESDWKTYISSSKELQQEIKSKGMESFSFYIIESFKTKREVIFAETKLQFVFDVLSSKIGDEFEYYNSNIMHKFFRGTDSIDSSGYVLYAKDIIAKVK